MLTVPLHPSRLQRDHLRKTGSVWVPLPAINRGHFHPPTVILSLCALKSRRRQAGRLRMSLGSETSRVAVDMFVAYKVTQSTDWRGRAQGRVEESKRSVSRHRSADSLGHLTLRVYARWATY